MGVPKRACSSALAHAVHAQFATYTVLVDDRGTILYRGGIDGDRTHLTDSSPLYLRDALDDAARILEVTAGVLLVGLALALPLGLVGLLVWFAGRQAAQRRRERALDAV